MHSVVGVSRAGRGWVLVGAVRCSVAGSLVREGIERIRCGVGSLGCCARAAGRSLALPRGVVMPAACRVLCGMPRLLLWCESGATQPTQHAVVEHASPIGLAHNMATRSVQVRMRRSRYAELHEVPVEAELWDELICGECGDEVVQE